MARPLRIEYPNAWYHVMNRGRRHEEIFVDTRDHQAFIDLLKAVSEMFNAQIAAYALMANHYHLLLRTPEGNINRIMRHVGGVYTQTFNRRHDHDGQLFRGRYKAILVDEDEYLLGLVRYIHHNPLKAGMVKKLEEYDWSSHRGYLSDDEAWQWLYREPVLKEFSTHLDEARRGYRRFMAQDDDGSLEDIFSKMNLPAFLGGKEFINKIKDRFFVAKANREVPTAKYLAPSAREIIAAILTIYEVEESTLFISKRGSTNEPRDVAIYLLRTLRGLPLQKIAEILSVRNYSTVSTTLTRVERRMAQDEEFKIKVAKVKAVVKKSQSET
ncbi:MAG: transposase [Desulfomicrobium sp.]|nr:transposase [Pseudomonadota bacterium]MBV1711077.1 transposase [Desulfomicrobium sp.]MBU4570731.1 transposase [Pseudomonadota bacterium]MBU4593495.1 transposase [Pseudomonadota bacterium]MBV1719191.1 transposase [Desulfomicrobium sp.]